ncbi:hypothetical protein V2J09_001558 [Rumex salicifolius]
MASFAAKMLILGVVVLLLASVEGTPPGLAKEPKRVKCNNTKYKYCNNLEHVCPKFCPDTCTVECVSCRPVCGSGETVTPPATIPSPSPPTPTTTPSPSPPTPTPSPPTPTTTPSPSPPTPAPTPPTPTTTPSPSPPTPTPSPPTPTTTPSPSPPTPTPSPPTPTTTPSPSPPTPTTTPSPSPPTPTPSPPTPTTTPSPTPPTPTPSPPTPTSTLLPSPPTPTTTPSPSPPTLMPSPPTPTTTPSPSPPTPTTTPSPSSPTPTPSPPTPTTTPSPSPPTLTPSPPTPTTTPLPSPPTPTTTPSPSSPTPTPSPPTPTTTPSPSPPTPTHSPPTPSPSLPIPTPTTLTPSPSTSPPSSSSPSQITPPSSASGQKRVRCKNKNYTCYGQEHVCPANCPTTCEVDCVTCKPICRCDYPGSVCQDPRFIGGDGITFYFHGKKDKNFCLLTDPNLHINGHFIGKRSPNMTRDFTWVQSLGILFETHRLFIGAERTSKWSDSVDRLALSYDDEPIFLPQTEGATWHSPTTPKLTLTRTTSNTNNIAVELEGRLKITAKAVPITEKDSEVHSYGITSHDCFAHLDLGFKFYSLTGDVEGVLGKTYRDDYVSKVNVGVKMPVLGGEDEYETSGLFASDCKVSRFHGLKSDLGLFERLLIYWR